MLKKEIEYIIKLKEQYGCDTWKYQLSGDFMEFSVRFTPQQNRDYYRYAVIQIGRVLKKLSTVMEKNGHPLHIQTFPNLEDSKLVAAIRINKKTTRKHQLNSEYSPQKTLLEVMKLEAHHQHLIFEKTSPPVFAGAAEHPVSDPDTWFLVSTDYDNPFTWLKIGYWMETVYQFQQVKEKATLLSFYFDTENKDLRRTPEHKTYTQALISLRS